MLPTLLSIVSLWDTSPGPGGSPLPLARVRFIPELSDELHVRRAAVSVIPVIFFIEIIRSPDGDISSLVCVRCLRKYSSETQTPPDLESSKAQEKWESKSQTRGDGSKAPSSSNPTLSDVQPSTSLLVLPSHDFPCASLSAKMRNYTLKPKPNQRLLLQTFCKHPVFCSSSRLFLIFRAQNSRTASVLQATPNQNHRPNCAIFLGHPSGDCCGQRHHNRRLDIFSEFLNSSVSI